MGAVIIGIIIIVIVGAGVMYRKRVGKPLTPIGIAILASVAFVIGVIALYGFMMLGP